jgi:hypothetical protein
VINPSSLVTHFVLHLSLSLSLSLVALNSHIHPKLPPSPTWSWDPDSNIHQQGSHISLSRSAHLSSDSLSSLLYNYFFPTSPVIFPLNLPTEPCSYIARRLIRLRPSWYNTLSCLQQSSSSFCNAASSRLNTLSIGRHPHLTCSPRVCYL